MKIEKIVVGPLETNCYLVRVANECLIIDPGDNFKQIKELVKDYQVVGCLITHFHQDHIGALEEVLSTYNLEINKVKSKKFNFEIIETPGHTFDSRTFYFKEDKIMFTGDFIFYHSIGRTDLGGSDKDMIYSLHLIEKYPDDITIYPGHGSKTTLGEEKKRFSLYID